MKIRWVSMILDDLLLLTGLASLVYGTFLIYLPAGYITLGTGLIVLAYLVARQRENR